MNSDNHETSVLYSNVLEVCLLFSTYQIMNINSKMFGRKIDLTTFLWTAKLLQKPNEAQGKQLSLADRKCENGFAWVREGADAHYKVITKQNYL